MSDDKRSAIWWRRALATRPAARGLVQGFGLLGSVFGLNGCLDYAVTSGLQPVELAESEHEVGVTMRALELQRREGWNVGHADQGLGFRGAVAADAAGSLAWDRNLPSLAERLAPAQPDLQPYYVPTLFQSLAGDDPGPVELRQAMRPIHTFEMDQAYYRGQSILSLFAEASFPPDTAIVVDLPGPESVALATSLAAHFEPIFVFDNWPHPRGIVPSHATAGAAIFYLPLLEQATRGRPDPAPPVFVLDADRLTPYADDGDEFDNRYLARLPTAANLGALGLRHLLYVTADGARTVETDDLNEAFVALQEAGIEVKVLALTDIQRSPEPPSPLPDDPAGAPPPLLAAAADGFFYFYGGSWIQHRCFWQRYGWHRPAGGRSFFVAPPPPHATSRGWAFTPVRRSTIFTHRVGPTLGHVSVHTARSNGGFSHFSSGRSGSFGRFHGGGSS